MSDPSDVVVRCYSGHRYAQEPLSFIWQGREYSVAMVESMRRVLDSSSGIVTVQFVVETSDRSRFRLSYDEQADAWTVECIR